MDFSSGTDRHTIDVNCKEVDWSSNSRFTMQRNGNTVYHQEPCQVEVLQSKRWQEHKTQVVEIQYFSDFGICSSGRFPLHTGKPGEPSTSVWKPLKRRPGHALPVITIDSPPIMLSGAQGSLHRIRCHTDQSVRDATHCSPPQLSLWSTVARWIDSRGLELH